MTEGTTPDATELLYAEGASCATLTPLIRARMRELASGEVLEVLADDPTARVDVPAWSRLTGNELISAVELDGQQTLFRLRKK